MKKYVIYSIVLILLMSVVSAIGEYANQAVYSPGSTITIEPKPWYMALVTKSGSKYYSNFFPGETITFVSDQTAYNIDCNAARAIVEVYNPSNKFIQAVRSNNVKLVRGENHYIKCLAQIPYAISSSETAFGTWNAATYIWCNDVTHEDIDGNGRIGQGEVISAIAKYSFQISKPGAACVNGDVGDNYCGETGAGKMDVYRQYRDCSKSTEIQRKLIDSCSSSEYCSAGSCINKVVEPGTTPGTPGVVPPPPPGDNNTLFIILGIAVTLIIALILVVVFSK